MSRLVVVLLTVLALSLPLYAKIRPLSGHEDPAFQAALQAWLKGDEEQALPALAALAAADNRAAQVLIGLIDVTPQYNGPWLMALPRADRIALMRVPSGKAAAQAGLSGRNWLHEAARTEPLAQAWLRLWNGAADAKVMLDFVRLGEDRAARTAAKWLARRQVRGFGALAADPDFPDFAKGLALQELGTAGPAAMQAADPGWSLVRAYDPDPTALLVFAQTHDALGLLDSHLAALCGNDPNTRANRLAKALDLIGGWWGLASLGSPVDALIDPKNWVASTQGLASFARLWPNVDQTRLTGMDPCFAQINAFKTNDHSRLK